MGRAWIVLTASPAKFRHDRFRKECNAGIFVMDCVTTEESRALRSVFIATTLFCLAYSHSIIYKLDVERVLENFRKWGPSARTFLRLGGTMTERELRSAVKIAAKKFAEDPNALNFEANPEVGSHVLFATFPDSPARESHTMRVATEHLYGFVVRAIAAIDASKQMSFYVRASCHPFFRGSFGYILEKYFYVWLSSNLGNELLCTAAKSGSCLRSIQANGRNSFVSDQSGGRT
jgi:hypothetical protein